MRIVYILITFVCLALSIVFMYFGFSNKSGITDANNMLAEQEQKVKDAQNNLNELQQTLASKKAEKSGLELQVRYRTEPTAFLTFNSVPSSNTAKILDILKENNVKATFYITGSLIQTDEDRAVVKRIVDEGHAIGIRAYGSDNVSEIFSSAEKYMEDVQKCAAMIKDITGTETKLVRMPGGTERAKSYCTQYGNGTETLREIMKSLHDAGYSVTDWYTDAGDYDSSASASSLLEVVKTAASSRTQNDGYKTYILLMYGTDVSVELLPDVISALKELGYNTFEKIVPGGYAYIKYPVDF